MRKEEKRRGKFPWGLPGIISLGVWLPFVSRREAGDWRDKKKEAETEKETEAETSSSESRLKSSQAFKAGTRGMLSAKKTEGNSAEEDA